MSDTEHTPEPGEEAAAPTEDAAAPPLNREQRRAQAKGKKATGPAFNPAQGNNLRGPAGKGHAGQVRFPRTGHK